MKKKILISLLAATLAISALTACGSSDSSGGSASTSETTTQTTGAGGYEFTANGTKIEIDAPAEETLNAIGDPIETYESPSCAFGDLDKVWTYSGFRIDTYQLEGTDYVLDVVFTDDSVSTDEGVSIGDTTDKMKEVYGEPTTEDSTQAVYENGDMKLVFLLDGENIKTIEYLSKKLDS